MLDSGEERGELLRLMTSSARIQGGRGGRTGGKRRPEIAAIRLSSDHGCSSSCWGRVAGPVDGVVGEEDVSFQDVVSTFKYAGTCSGPGGEAR